MTIFEDLTEVKILELLGFPKKSYSKLKVAKINIKTSNSADILFDKFKKRYYLDINLTGESSAK